MVHGFNTIAPTISLSSSRAACHVLAAGPPQTPHLYGASSSPGNPLLALQAAPGEPSPLSVPLCTGRCKIRPAGRQLLLAGCRHDLPPSAMKAAPHCLSEGMLSQTCEWWRLLSPPCSVTLLCAWLGIVSGAPNTASAVDTPESSFGAALMPSRVHSR